MSRDRNNIYTYSDCMGFVSGSRTKFWFKIGSSTETYIPYANAKMIFLLKTGEINLGLPACHQSNCTRNSQNSPEFWLFWVQ